MSFFFPNARGRPLPVSHFPLPTAALALLGALSSPFISEGRGVRRASLDV